MNVKILLKFRRLHPVRGREKGPDVAPLLAAPEAEDVAQVEVS